MRHRVGRISRRHVLGGGVAAAVAVLTNSPSSAAEAVDVLRVRVEGIDALLARARKGHDEGRLTRDAYLAVLHLLRDEEADLHAAAAAATYADEAAANYWHRGRLKFPSLTQQELARMTRQP